jgi:hypothetical protein
MRGQQVPLDRFFPTAGGTASGSRDCAIDAPQLLVDLAGVEAYGSQTTKDFVQSAVCIPRVEQIPHRCPGLIFFRQVAPWRSGPQYPQDCIDNGASIPWRSPGLSRCWKKIRNTVPFFIRKLMPRHPLPPLSGLRHHFAQILETGKYQFSDNT